MIWKDHATSPYFIDTADKDLPPGCQHVVLRLTSRGELETEDHFVLGSVPDETRTALKLKKGNLLRFLIRGVHDGESPAIVDPVFQKKCGPLRDKADSWSRIVFKHLSKSSSPLSYDLLRSRGREGGREMDFV